MILMWSCPGNMPKYYPGLRDILNIFLLISMEKNRAIYPYAYFGHSWSYFDIQNLRLVIQYVFARYMYIALF